MYVSLVFFEFVDRYYLFTAVLYFLNVHFAVECLLFAISRLDDNLIPNAQTMTFKGDEK